MSGGHRPVDLAVILAAGEGSRLFARTDCPKPLAGVLGLSLAERVVCVLKQGADVEKIVVVLGHEARTVREHFAEVCARRSVDVVFVEAAEWRSGNGASALAAREAVGERPFYLCMVDHLFEPEVLARLACAPPLPGEMRLAVDRDRQGIFDLDDVTRVKLAPDGERIAEIGKLLDDWDAADTGVMLCSDGLFEGLGRAAAQGRHGLSDGLRELVRDGRARTVDVTGYAWLDVDTPAAFEEARRRLLARHGRKDRDGPVARHLNRPLSRRLTSLLVRTPVTPNQISVISWLISCCAAALFALGGYEGPPLGLGPLSGYPSLVLGAVLAQAASIIDGCDGEIARLKNIESAFGGWFDAVLDRYADGFLLFGLTWHVFASTGSELSLIIGFAAILGSFMNSYTADKYDGLMRERFGAASRFRLGRDVRVFVIFLGALANLPLATLAVVAAVMNGEVVRRIIVCAR
jgi:CDP-L-myo-inositol myo-inositolphosphotransferase